MSKIFASISCNPDTNILQAAIPLFEQEKVEALEWSFDTLYKIQAIPDWFTELLQTFSNENRLTGHGVYFSLFSGRWLKEQEQWLRQLSDISGQFKFDHITEHFGFMTGENFHTGAPLSIPFTKQTLAIGQDRLKRIYNACGCPVGLENLAFAYSAEDVKKYGDFLQQLLQPVNGFIILDIHNMYCQMQNFDIAFEELLQLYPLELVREMHISGGSWEDSAATPGRKIRRDTHDDGVPGEVFQMLAYAIDKCPHVKYVVLEQLSYALDTEERRNLFQQNFLQLATIIEKKNAQRLNRQLKNFLPAEILFNPQPLEDEILYQQQSDLSHILESASSHVHAMQLLQQSGFSDTYWEIEKWQPHMLETAIAIAQKWKNGFD